MTSFRNLTPDQREVAARLDIERLERDLKQMFRRVSRIEAVRAIGEWHKRSNGFRQSPPHVVDQLVSAAAAYGTDVGTRVVNKQLVQKAASYCIQVGNPIHLVWSDRIGDLDMFMPIVYREQVQLQLNANRSIYARMRCLFLDLLDAKTRTVIESRLGHSIEQLLHGAYFVNLLGLVPLKPTEAYRVLDNSAIDLYLQSNLVPGGIDAAIGLLGKPVVDFGALYRDRLDRLDNKLHGRSLRPLLLEYPILQLSPGVSDVPIANAIPYSLYWAIGSAARAGGCDRAFGTAFANYARKVVGSLKPSGLHRPDEEDHPGRRCDIKAVFDDYDVLIECKATRFTKEIITPKSITKDSTTEKIASACEQLANTVKRGRHQVAVIVVDDNLPVPNSDWYWSMIFHDWPKASLWVSQIGSRPLVWGLDVLEAVVEASLASGKSIPEIIALYQARPYRVHGEWDTWMSTYRSEVRESGEIALLDWKQAYIDEHFSLESSGPQ